MSQLSPGWYDDPQTPGQLRFWDGRNWAPPPPPPPRGQGWRRFKFLGLGAVATPVLIYALTHSSAGANACNSGISERVDLVSSKLCLDEHLRVPDERARDFVDTLLAAVNGSQRGALVHATLMKADDVTAAETTATWHRVIRAERLGELARVEGRNRFAVTIRIFVVPEETIDSPTFYTAPMSVYQRRLTLTLARTDDGIRASSVTLPGNDPEGVFRPEKTVLTTTSDFYDRPVREADAMPNLQPGDSVWSICQLRREGEDAWWSFTYLGWVPHQDMAIGDVQLPGLRECVYRPKP